MEPTLTPTFGGGPAWEALDAQLARLCAPISPEREREERAIADVLARYMYLLDRADASGIADLLTDDCTFTHLRGTIEGRAEVIADYQRQFANGDRFFHVLGAIVVRVADDLVEGWATSNHFTVVERARTGTMLFGGIIADHLVRADGGWRIRTRCTSIDVTMGARLPSIS